MKPASIPALVICAIIALSLAPALAFSGSESQPKPPLVAVMPEVLVQKLPGKEQQFKRGGTLAVLVQASLGADPRWAFVEREQIQVIESEQELAAAGASREAAALGTVSALRRARLAGASRVLSIRLFGDRENPRVLVEVADALRAERLARVEETLSPDLLPNESWLSMPPDAAVASVAGCVTRALETADAGAARLEDMTVVAPLAFVNRSATDRLEPLGRALDEALRHRWSREDSRIHVLSIGREMADGATGHSIGAEGTFDESLLVLAGMSAESQEAWARVADVLVWGEFSEAGDDGPHGWRPLETPVTLTVRWSAGGDKTGSLRMDGTLGNLPQLAEKMAAQVTDKVRGLKGRLSAEDRLKAAAFMSEAASAQGSESRARATERSRERFAEAAHRMSVAAFLAPENREWRELRVQMGMSVCEDRRERPGYDLASWRNYWATEFWRVYDQFGVDAQGRVDLGLMARGARYPIFTTGASERFMKAGRLLAGARIKRSTWPFGDFCEKFLSQLQAYDVELARRREIFEAMWPVVRQGIQNEKEKAFSVVHFIYEGDSVRATKALDGDSGSKPAAGMAEAAQSREGAPVWFVSDDPMRIFRASPGGRGAGVAGRGAARPEEFFIRVRPSLKDRMAAQPLKPRSAWERVRSLFSSDEPETIAAAVAIPPPLPVLDPEELPAARWMSLGWAWAKGARRGDNLADWMDDVSAVCAEPRGVWGVIPEKWGRKRYGAADQNGLFLDFAGFGLGSAGSVAGVSPAERITDVALVGGEVWLAAYGGGIRIVEPGPLTDAPGAGKTRRLTGAEGLLRDDVAELAAGKGFVLAGDKVARRQWDADGNTEMISSVATDLSRITKAALPDSAALRGIPPVERAAIQSFGNDAARLVKLPEQVGRILWKPLPDREREIRQNRREGEMSGPSFCPTGAGDGYWVSDGRSVAWAAGERMQPLATWESAEVGALADDGRHLFVAASIDGFPVPHYFTPRPTWDGLRVYVYDYREGAWRGWFRVPGPVTAMAATPGVLVFATMGTGVYDHGVMFVSTGMIAPPSGGAVGGVLSAVVAGDLPALRAAIAAGADVNEASPWGWTPLMAALWRAPDAFPDNEKVTTSGAAAGPEGPGNADDLAMVRMLLDAGARCDVSNAWGWHPLFVAAAWSRPGGVRLLLDAGAKADYRMEPVLVNGRPVAAARVRPTALHGAICSDRADVLAMLLEAGADPVLADGLGRSAFALAATHAGETVAGKLLATGAVRRAEALRLATAAGRAGLESAADPSAAGVASSDGEKQSNGDSTTKEGVGKRDQEMLDMELRAVVARERGERLLSAIKPLLEAGANPVREIREEEQGGVRTGATAIEMAMRQRQTEAIEMMIRHMAIDSLNTARKTDWQRPGTSVGAMLLRLLLDRGYPEQAALLLERGLAPDVKADEELGKMNDSVYPLLRVAVLHGNSRGDAAEVVRALRRSGFRRLARRVARMRDESVMAGIVRMRDAVSLEALFEPIPDSLVELRAWDEVEQLRKVTGSTNPFFPVVEAGWREGIEALVRAGVERNAMSNSTEKTLADIIRDRPELAVIFNGRPGLPDNTLEGARALLAVANKESAPPDSLFTPAVLRYRDQDGAGVLLISVRNGDGKTVRRILDAARGLGIDPGLSDQTWRGETVVNAAATACDASTVKALLDAGADPDGPRDAWTPLVAAAREGRSDVVKVLVEAGADVRRMDRLGFQPVIAACMTTGEMESLKILLGTGKAGLDALTDEGHGVLEAAVISNSPEKIQWLLDQGAKWALPWKEDYHPLNTAARRGLAGSVRKLLELGLYSPKALSLARDDATRAVLQAYGGEVMHQSGEDEALWPEILADDRNWQKRAEERLAAGGNVNHQSMYWTPLSLALDTDDPERVRFLIERGAKPDAGGRNTMMLGPVTVYYVWLSSRAGKHHDEPKTDAMALACLDIFWPYDRDSYVRSSLLAAAVRGNMPKTAIRMIELGTSKEKAVREFRENTLFTPEQRTQWVKILGLTE
ncbi:hypothetical protein OpiT1DRAFT_02474 [Opitutaceae bacterium TAV1]|nr:hypothetical protein OpiT1DRAFT_02474 [Opitutaceae bacterium TAV1]